MSPAPSAASPRTATPGLRAWALALLMAVGLALGLTPGAAHAAASCTATVSDGGFGAVDVLAGGTVDTTATLTFSCTGMVPAVPVTLCPNLDGGSAGGNGSGGRLLAGPSGGAMSFQVYQDSARSVPWGSSSFLAFGAAPTITVSPDTSGKASTTRMLYARLTTASTAPPGSYASSFASQNFFWGLNLLSCAGITIGTTIAPATFTFSASVASNCGVSATTLAFGNVGLLTTAVQNQNVVSVRCTASTPYTLGLNNGLNGTGPTARKMIKGTAQVTYGVYKDSARTVAWGDISQGLGAVQSATGTGAAQTFTGYGKVPVQATPAPGAYADTVVATLTY